MGKNNIIVIITAAALATCLATACGVRQEAETTAEETAAIVETESETDVTEESKESNEETEEISLDFLYTVELAYAPEGFSDEITINFVDMKINPYQSLDGMGVILSEENGYQNQVMLASDIVHVNKMSFSSGNDYSYDFSYDYGDHICTVRLFVTEEPSWMTGCTNEQDEIIREAVNDLVYVLFKQEENPVSLNRNDVTTDFLVEYLYGVLKFAGEDSSIVTYIGTDADSRPIYDKESALKNIGDIFAKTLTEGDVDSYNERYRLEHGEDFLKIDNDTISILADNPDDINITCMRYNYLYGDTTLAFYFDYKVETTLEDWNPYKSISASFVSDKNSFFAYSCFGINIHDDTNYIEHPAPELTGEIVTYEGDLFYEGGGDIMTPPKFQEYELDFRDPEGELNYVYLKDENGNRCNCYDQEEWNWYTKVRITGELDSDGYLWVYEITPLVMWDINTGEEVYLE